MTKNVAECALMLDLFLFKYPINVQLYCTVQTSLLAS